ncbi:MAG: transporter substrate-binding domain-containing protein [Spirochaetia bacterium]|nr:transporter substrate-binding domain-containing protein [Spirochaetia bacterium]
MALLDLKAGRTDAVVVDEIMGRYYIGKRPGEYKVLNEDFGREEYGIGFRQEDDAFRKKVDAILKEMNEDGTTAEISKKWFGEDIVLK